MRTWLVGLVGAAALVVASPARAEGPKLDPVTPSANPQLPSPPLVMRATLPPASLERELAAAEGSRAALVETAYPSARPPSSEEPRSGVAMAQTLSVPATPAPSLRRLLVASAALLLFLWTGWRVFSHLRAAAPPLAPKRRRTSRA